MERLLNSNMNSESALISANKKMMCELSNLLLQQKEQYMKTVIELFCSMNNDFQDELTGLCGEDMIDPVTYKFMTKPRYLHCFHVFDEDTLHEIMRRTFDAKCPLCRANYSEFFTTLHEAKCKKLELECKKLESEFQDGRDEIEYQYEKSMDLLEQQEREELEIVSSAEVRAVMRTFNPVAVGVPPEPGRRREYRGILHICGFRIYY